MLQFSIVFDFEVAPALYDAYCHFLFGKIKQKIREKANPRRYKVREPYVLNSSLIHWNKEPPKSLNLLWYLENCLEMVKVDGVYVIRLNRRRRINGSSTRVSTLVRMLEYGTTRIPPLPLVRRIMFYYSQVYQELILEFMEERFWG